MASKRTAKKPSTGKLKSYQSSRQLKSGKPTTFTGVGADEIAMLADLEAKDRLEVFDATSPTGYRTSPVVGARRVDATVWLQKNITIVKLVVTDRKGKKHELMGATKRNPYDDYYDEGRGRRVALARAARGEAVQQ